MFSLVKATLKKKNRFLGGGGVWNLLERGRTNPGTHLGFLATGGMPT